MDSTLVTSNIREWDRIQLLVAVLQRVYQLITKVQVTANNVDDPRLLLEALPNLKERTELEALYTDGGFGSYAVDQAMLEYKVIHMPMGIRGR
jgi:hypothetical protein